MTTTVSAKQDATAGDGKGGMIGAMTNAATHTAGPAASLERSHREAGAKRHGAPDAPDSAGTDRGALWLARGHLRPTRQRLSLATLLVGDGQDRHVTAEWLYAAALEAGEKVSLATVYNTLRAFSEAGLLQEVLVDGNRSYFDTRTDHHPHFYWEDSAEMTDARPEDLQISSLPQPPEGMEIARVDVVIRLRRA